MFITYRKHTATSGTLESRFDYVCAHCGAQAAALVHSVGASTSMSTYGESGGAERAREAAAQWAWINAQHAIGSAACPRCRALPPAIVSQIETARAEVDRSRRRRLPAAAIAAGITPVLGGIAAAKDFASSTALVYVSVAVAILVGASVFATRAWPHHVPKLHEGSRVWFWWGGPTGEPEWVPAPLPAAPPPPIEMSRVANLLGGAIALTALIGAIVALVVWGQTFMDVYVVNVAGKGELSIRADGKEAGTTKRGTGVDVAYAKLTVRRGHAHRIVVTDEAGVQQTFTLDEAKDDKRGWVIAPDAAREDLCIVDAETVYSSSSTAREPDAKLLNAEANGGPVLAVHHGFDYVFEPGPTSISSKESEVRKRTLRAYVCSELLEDRLVAYRDRK